MPDKMNPLNYIRKVAIVGAGGHIGTHVTTQLLGTGKHTVTAITRAESQSKFPQSVVRSEVDYNRPETIVEALKGQDCLIVTLNFAAGAGTEDTLIEAAATAGVPWVLPNEWGPDSEHEGLAQDISSLTDKPRIRQKIRELGKSSYLSVMCGLWYEWCLSTPVLYGIDCVKKEATLFDEGETKTSTSTWPQIGRAVAALLSLPISSSDPQHPGACLNEFKNSAVYISSFEINQREMLDSILRVTGDSVANWTIKKQPVKVRYETGLEARRIGTDRQKGRLVYSRVFFPDGAGNHGKTRVLANDVLGLPQEALDDATQIAIKMQLNP